MPLTDTAIRQAKPADKPETASVTSLRKAPAPAPRPLEAPAGREGLPKRRIHAAGGDDYSIPAYLRQSRTLGDAAGPAAPAKPVHSHKPSGPGEEDFVFDEEEFEIPSFIRMQAD